MNHLLKNNLLPSFSALHMHPFTVTIMSFHRFLQLNTSLSFAVLYLVHNVTEQGYNHVCRFHYLLLFNNCLSVARCLVMSLNKATTVSSSFLFLTTKHATSFVLQCFVTSIYDGYDWRYVPVLSPDINTVFMVSYYKLATFLLCTISCSTLNYVCSNSHVAFPILMRDRHFQCKNFIKKAKTDTHIK